MNKELEARFLRQIDILKPKVCDKSVLIVGAGATGSATALYLAKMGLTNIKVFDGDKVEEHNFPNQVYPLKSLGKHKVTALKDLVKEYTGVTIKAVPFFFEHQPINEEIVISALDSMEGRMQIYKKCQQNGKVKILIDPRTAPEAFNLYTVDMKSDKAKKDYEKDLHPDNEAVEAPCTGRSIIYSVLLVSGYICNQVKKYLMNQPYKKYIISDMRNYIFSV